MTDNRTLTEKIVAAKVGDTFTQTVFGLTNTVKVVEIKSVGEDLPDQQPFLEGDEPTAADNSGSGVVSGSSILDKATVKGSNVE